jgi:hypothetical protein
MASAIDDRRPAHPVDTALSGLEQHHARAVATARHRATPASRRTPHGSWWVFAVIACAMCAALGAAIWLSTRLQPDPALRNVALFVHLASAILGFGAVLAADYFLALWLARRGTLAEAIQVTARLHWPIWGGLLGLVLSGTLLAPDLAATMTRMKLAFVVIVILNGLQAAALHRRVKAATETLGIRLLAWGTMTATLSQVCWWGAVWIGFWNALHSH